MDIRRFEFNDQMKFALIDGKLYMEVREIVDFNLDGPVIKNGVVFEEKPAKRHYKKRKPKDGSDALNRKSGSRKRLSPETRSAIEYKIEKGATCEEVVSEFGISNFTYYKIKKDVSNGEKTDEPDAEFKPVSRKVECVGGCLTFSTTKAIVGPDRAKCPDCHGAVKLVDENE